MFIKHIPHIYHIYIYIDVWGLHNPEEREGGSPGLKNNIDMARGLSGSDCGRVSFQHNLREHTLGATWASSNPILLKTFHQTKEYIYTYIYLIALSFLWNHSFIVVSESWISCPINLTCGIPQGALFLPVLFSIYTWRIIGTRC